MGRISLFVAALVAVGCTADAADTGWRVPPPDPSEHWDKDCSGTYADNGCDDCNPCTDDVWCDETPADNLIVCNGIYGRCVHTAWTSGDGVINACFPTVLAIEAGKCCNGVCVENSVGCVGGAQ